MREEDYISERQLAALLQNYDVRLKKAIEFIEKDNKEKAVTEIKSVLDNIDFYMNT